MDRLPVVRRRANTGLCFRPCRSVLCRATHLSEMQIYPRLQGMCSLGPQYRVPTVNDVIESERARATCIYVGNCLIEELQQVVVDLKLRIESRSLGSQGFAIWNAAPIICPKHDVHGLQHFENALYQLV